MNMPHRHETGFYGQQALFGRDLQPNPNALPPELRPEPRPAHAADGTTPYIEQTGGEHTYDAEIDITGEEALMLVKQGLGGREMHRRASHYQDRLRDGTADKRSDLTKDELERAHQVYEQATEAQMRRTAERFEQESAQAPPVYDASGLRDYRSERPNPLAVRLRVQRERHEAHVPPRLRNK